jgi:hypothetical protein
MSRLNNALSVAGLTLAVAFAMSASDQTGHAQQRGSANAPAAGGNAPSSVPMGGNKSVTRFFVTSKGLGKGGDLGGLAGADAHCQTLAQAQGAGDHTWRAYLSTEATATAPAVNARDRIGGGPWYNSGGDLVAPHLAALHGSQSKLAKDTAVTEVYDEVGPEAHEILTGHARTEPRSPATRSARATTGPRAVPEVLRSATPIARARAIDRTRGTPHTRRAAAAKGLSASPAAPACSTASRSIRRHHIVATAGSSTLGTCTAIAESFRPFFAVPMSIAALQLWNIRYCLRSCA